MSITEIVGAFIMATFMPSAAIVAGGVIAMLLLVLFLDLFRDMLPKDKS
jgi:hypothetical protein